MIYRLGQTNCAAAIAEFSDKQRQQIHAQLMEYITRVTMPGCSMHLGKHVDRMVTIYDLSGISMGCAAAPTYQGSMLAGDGRSLPCSICVEAMLLAYRLLLLHVPAVRPTPMQRC